MTFHRHINPDCRLGGYVEDTAYVDPTCWIAPNAFVFHNAIVTGNACIKCNARVFGDAVVEDDAIVRDGAWVYEHARVSKRAIVCGAARVRGRAHVTDFGWVVGCKLTDNVRVIGNGYVNEHNFVDITEYNRARDAQNEMKLDKVGVFVGDYVISEHRFPPKHKLRTLDDDYTQRDVGLHQVNNYEPCVLDPVKTKALFDEFI